MHKHVRQELIIFFSKILVMKRKRETIKREV